MRLCCLISIVLLSPFYNQKKTVKVASDDVFWRIFRRDKKERKKYQITTQINFFGSAMYSFFSRLCVERKLSEKYTSNRIFCFQKEKKMSGVDHKQPAKQTAAPAVSVRVV